MAEPTKAELEEFGRRFLAAKEKEQSRNRATAEAIKRLKEAHPEQYKKFYNEALGS